MKYYVNQNIPDHIPSKSMYQFILDANKERMQNTAMCFFGREISYGSFFNMIDCAAVAFRSHGIHAGDTVGILSINTPEMAACLYGLNKIGAIVDLMSPYSTQEELYDELKSIDAKLLIVLDKLMEKLDLSLSPVPVLVLEIAQSMAGLARIFMNLKSSKTKFCTFQKYTAEGKKQSFENQPEVTGDKPALYLHTSGTTGVPKSVVMTNDNLNAIAVQCSLSGKNYQPSEYFLNILPPFISFGAGMMHLCFYVGIKEIIHPVPTVKSVGKMFQKYNPVRFVFGPALLELIEECPNKDLSHVIEITGGGAAISAEKEKKVNAILKEKKGPSKYLSGYGMSELGSAVTMNQDFASKFQSVGFPLPMANVKIVSTETGEELTYDCEGELYISTPSLMPGYLDDPEETQKVIETDSNGTRWIKTGDLAKIDRDGFIFVTGRIKRIYTIRFNGEIFKIFPQRMENIVETVPEVEICGVVMLADEERGNKPYVFVKTTEESVRELVLKKIKETIHTQLLPYYETDCIILIEKMPLTLSQKIDYRELEKRALNML